MDSHSNNEIQKTCAKLKEQYDIKDEEYTLSNSPNKRFTQTISKDGNNIGGITIKNVNDEENIVGVDAIEFEKIRKGHGRNIIGWIFCDTKIEKILASPVDKSRVFWQKMGIVDIKHHREDDTNQGEYEGEIIREIFFEKNIEKIKSKLKI